ncbi:hypothetical protein H6503_05170 [Candidatus Woesearchaeota archaeon]|nr:hypothetical protein [Candidatus Woesearchaeota archaeon]
MNKLTSTVLALAAAVGTAAAGSIDGKIADSEFQPLLVDQVEAAPLYTLQCNVVLKPDGFYVRHGVDQIFGLVKEFYGDIGVDVDFRFYLNENDLPIALPASFNIVELGIDEIADRIIKPEREKLQFILENASAQALDYKEKLDELRKGEGYSKVTEDFYLEVVATYEDLAVMSKSKLDALDSELDSYYLFRLGEAHLGDNSVFLLNPLSVSLSELTDKLSEMLSNLGYENDSRPESYYVKSGADTVAHEIAHLLGLGHTFDDPNIDDYVSEGLPNLMSYRSVDPAAKYGFDITDRQKRQIVDYFKRLD